MKLITAMIRSDKLEAVQTAVTERDVTTLEQWFRIPAGFSSAAPELEVVGGTPRRTS
jgi:hypothetical protein